MTGEYLVEKVPGSERERLWFGQIVTDAKLSQASGESEAGNLEKFVRNVWQDYLIRVQGALSAVTKDVGIENFRVELSCWVKFLNELKWSKVKDLIRKLLSDKRFDLINGSD